MEGVYQTKKLARGGVRALGDKTRGRGTSCGGGQIEKAIHLRGQIYAYILGHPTPGELGTGSACQHGPKTPCPRRRARQPGPVDSARAPDVRSV